MRRAPASAPSGRRSPSCTEMRGALLRLEGPALRILPADSCSRGHVFLILQCTHAWDGLLFMPLGLPHILESLRESQREGWGDNAASALGTTSAAAFLPRDRELELPRLQCLEGDFAFKCEGNLL